VLSIFASQHDMVYEVAFTGRFGTSAPEELNGARKLTVITTAPEPARDWDIMNS
jgi:hypothetical protein